ncbi:MAG: hypothetical protein J6V14_00620, partial [Clostridia bacterium]|nr:hypothetical protein [Clostridia bacterium]
MNRQTAEKVRFFMNGLAGRLASIYEIEATFRSGLKNYTLTAPVETGDRLAFNFGGNTYALDYAGFVDFICGKVPDYDELLIVYRDEDKDNQIAAADRDVTFRSADRSVKRGAAALNEAHEAITQASMSNRAYFIKPEQPAAAQMLKAIGIMGDNGKVKNDKIR